MLIVILAGLAVANIVPCRDFELHSFNGEILELVYDQSSQKLKAKDGVCFNGNSKFEPFKIATKLGCPTRGMFLRDQIMTALTMTCMRPSERRVMAEKLERNTIMSGHPYFSRNQVSAGKPPVSLGSYMVTYDSPRGSLDLEKKVDVHDRFVVLSQYGGVYSLKGGKSVSNDKTVVFVSMQFFLSSIGNKRGPFVIDLSGAQSEKQVTIGFLRQKVTVYEFENQEMIVVIAPDWTPASAPKLRH
jgi:hypothetical protein